ncbi:response regulator [Ekhidna sp.]|uniref:response regulator n=1 Tax=Ekhidna sp. TaxID=2608089 RepID=UPI003CCBE396
MNWSDKNHIVIVEDSEDDAKLAMKSFKELKSIKEIVWLKDGEEALHYFKGKGAYEKRDLSVKPKLIFLDLKLPKISGVDVLAELKIDSTYDEVPIVVVTSSGENRDLERCYELGANSYVVKPIDYSEFRNLTATVSQYWTMINQIP